MSEPYKIKTVEPLHITTRADRESAITRAGHNTFLLRSEDVYIAVAAVLHRTLCTG